MGNTEKNSTAPQKKRKGRKKHIDTAGKQFAFIEELILQLRVRDANLTSRQAEGEDADEPNLDFWSLGDKDRITAINTCMRTLTEIRGRRDLEDQLARIIANHDLLLQQIRARAPHVLEGMRNGQGQV